MFRASCPVLVQISAAMALDNLARDLLVEEITIRKVWIDLERLAYMLIVLW